MTTTWTQIPLPRALPPAWGMGAYLKASMCRIDGAMAHVSPDAGDLGTLEAIEIYSKYLSELTDARPPAMIAHDLHPDFHSSRMAQETGHPTLAVQHHHAHTLATQWENGHEGPLLGLSLDGFGLGPGGASWGGELLRVHGPDCTRIGHLAPLPQPGGDVAAREPWRMGAAALWRLGRGAEIAARYAGMPHAALLDQMLERGLNAPETSSCGRLFDAACGILGVHPVAQYEGQAPMALETLATAPETMEDGWTLDHGQLDFLPLLDRLTTLAPQPGANLFHGTLAAGLAALVRAAADQTGLTTVAFGGGCFFNRVLTSRLSDLLEKQGLIVLSPKQLSPGDAGLSFGQAIAAALTVERAQNGAAPCA